MVLKVIAGLLVALAVAVTGAALVHNGHCPFSHSCCDTGAAPTSDAEPSCCSQMQESGSTTPDCCASETATKKAACCEESKVAGEDK
jgi:hypothetical protein